MADDLSIVIQTIRQHMDAGPAAVGGLVMARVLPIVSLTPIFGGPETPRRFRFGLSLLLTLVLLPSFAGSFSARHTGPVYIMSLATQAAVGLAFAVAIIIVFEMLSAAGSITDLVRDANLLNIFDPSTQDQVSPLSMLLRRLNVLLFFTLGGHRLLLKALGASFVTVPLFASPAMMKNIPIAGPAIIGLFCDMISVAVRFAAPVIVLMLTIEVSMGLVSRVSSSLDISLMTRLSKLMLGLWCFLLVLGYGFERVLGSVMNQLLRFIAGS